jgi:hypothetical protein
MPDLPDHLTPAQFAALFHLDVADVQQQIERGSIRCEPEGIPRGEVEGMAVVQALTPELFEVTEGVGSSNTPLPNRRCHACGETGGVHYMGSDCLEGSLEFVHLVHTEAEHAFRCERCGGTWSEFKIL